MYMYQCHIVGVNRGLTINRLIGTLTLNWATSDLLISSENEANLRKLSDFKYNVNCSLDTCMFIWLDNLTAATKYVTFIWDERGSVQTFIIWPIKVYFSLI